MDGIRCFLSSVRMRGITDYNTKPPTVGWVERSETHRPLAIRRKMGFAALYPSYGPCLANDPEARWRLLGPIRRAVVHVHGDGGCLRFANHFVGIEPVGSDRAFVGWLHRHVVGEQPFLLCRAHVQRQGRPGADFSGALARGVLTGRADEPRQVPALAFGPANLDRLLRLEAVPFRSVRYGSRRPRRGAAREHGGWKDQTPEFAHIHPPKSQPAPP